MKECPSCHRCFPDQADRCPTDESLLNSTFPVPIVLDSRYELRRLLGQGGMGAVYKARHIFLKTTHAIKLILPDLVGNDPELAKRFRQEAMAAAAIRHHNVIAVTDYGLVNSTLPFLVMEFVQGHSLQEVLAKEKLLTPRRALEFMSAIGAGVGAAHRRGIVHRDLKPLNVMLEDDLPISDGVKVLDFGLAKIRSGELLGSFVAAKTTGIMGSPFYMAPEQWSDEEPDQRADIYSLGIILYQMLAGDVPFKGPSVPSIMKKHLMDAPPRFIDVGMDISEGIEAVVRRSLEKDPQWRPQTVAEFIDELRVAVERDSVIRSISAVNQSETLVATSDQLDGKVIEQQLAGTISADALGQTAGEQARLEAQRREAEVQRQREEEAARLHAELERERAEKEAQEREARRLEEERRQREAAEAAKRAEEERQRKEREAAERRAAEEAERQRKETEARRAAEEAARLAEERRLAEEAARRAEEEQRKREAEEAARRAEEERQRRAAAEAARLAEEVRKAEEERLRQEEEARVRAAEAARLAEEQRLAEETARQAAEEQQRREAEAAQRAAEEAQRKREAEEAVRRAEEERQRKAEERQRKAKEERQRKAEARRREAEEARAHAEAEAARQAAEEAERLQAEEAARAAELARQQQEEAARQRAEEARRAQEEAARRQAEEEQRRQEEAVRQRAIEEAARAAEAEQQHEAAEQAASLQAEAVKQVEGEAQMITSDELESDVSVGPEQAAQPAGLISYPPPVTRLAEESMQQTIGMLAQDATTFDQPTETVPSAAPDYTPFGASISPPQSRISTPLIVGLIVALLLFGGGGTGLYLWMHGSQTRTTSNNPANNTANNNGPSHDQPTAPWNMVLITGGTFQMGRNDVHKDDPQYPAHSVTVKSFYIDKTEVTNEEYAEFVRDTKHPAPRNDLSNDQATNYWKPWFNGRPPVGQERWPVRNVNLADVVAFAAWRSKRDRRNYRLPTEEEWEYAARGSQNNLYPWGNTWVDGYAVLDGDTPSLVGSIAQGATQAGVLDLIGNVWEWTASKYSYYEGNQTPLAADQRGSMVIRGGSYQSMNPNAPANRGGNREFPATWRDYIPARTKDPTIGFRLISPVE